MRNGKLTNRFFVTWHRRVGLFVALLALILCVTGVLLQHTERFKLDRTYLTAPWLLNWYNYPEPRVDAIQLSQQQVRQIDDQILLAQTIVGQSKGQLWGAAETSETVLIASGHVLIWLTLDGEIIDVMPTPIAEASSTLARTGEQFQIWTPNGWLIADPELSNWQAGPDPGELPLAVEPSDFRQAALPPELSVGVSLERLLLDLHSGRLFGFIGVLLMDLASIGLVLLAISGCWLWLRRR
ncbi:PepSY domain-containing protein [Neiella marina]|uniref:PepSY domain-containing protein n=1 Tax=Neiella holothuriorum TaxID=2870530 RepID=A0ABS7EC24_9GAMM|nr:PepSY-associated TM helix domain-containing protein [Neiella holothuriorum]MBW8189883.1 PepSY domain-containing protein [Neiella holothuriorum]